MNFLKKHLFWLVIGIIFGLISFIPSNVFYLFRSQKKIASLENKLAKLKKREEKLRRYIDAFRKDSFNNDLLEFRIRKILGYVRKDEEIYFWKEEF